MTQHDPIPPLPNYSESDDDSVISVASTFFESETLTRVEELWFEEDNLIIRAEDSLFRVSKGILAARSPVLKAMLFGPRQPSPKTEEMYGCSVVELPHSARSVTHFLKAIFDSEFFLPPPERSLFWVVVEILQLAYEYDVKYLFKRALLHFETYYPTVIDGERVYDPSDDAPGDSSNEDDGDDAVVKNCDLVALKVALEVGALWNIPCIMYDCCTTDLAHLLDLSEWEGLSADQKLQILVAHDKQKSGTRVVSEFLLADHPAECVSNDACNLAKLDWLRILDRRSREGEDSDPLLFWGEGDWEDMGRDFCEVCLVHFEESYRKQRGVLWNGLPESLGLTKWEDMLKMKDEISKSK